MKNIKIGDKKYFIQSDDSYIEWLGDIFEPDMVRLFKSLVKKNDIIFDVGANIGCTSLLFGELGGVVYSFEPIPSTFNLLDKNLKMSGVDNVFVHNYGLGSDNQIHTISRAPNNRSGAFVSDTLGCEHKGLISEQVNVRMLDSVFDEIGSQRLDFLKIDVEGFEKHVISGGVAVINRFMPLVVMELNHWCLNAFQRTSIPDFFDFLRSIFPIVYAVDGDKYLDIGVGDQAYEVMYQNIINMKYQNIVAGFDVARLNDFYKNFSLAR